jgi:hypothetical protein
MIHSRILGERHHAPIFGEAQTVTVSHSQWSPELWAKLAKLIRLLTSPREGEALAAARAIERTLASEGADIHDLADALTGPASQQTPPASHPSNRHRTPRPPSGQPESGKTTDEYLKYFWIGYCRWCLHRAAELTKSELVFVHKVLEGLSANRPYEDAEIRRLMRICERLERRA